MTAERLACSVCQLREGDSAGLTVGVEVTLVHVPGGHGPLPLCGYCEPCPWCGRYGTDCADERGPARLHPEDGDRVSHYYRTAAWALAFLIAVAGTLWTVLVVAGHPQQAHEAASGVAAGGLAVVVLLGCAALCLDGDVGPPDDPDDEP